MQDFCTWNVRGLNIPLDLEDAETSKNYQQAAELLKAFGTQEQLSNEAERIRADCAVIRVGRSDHRFPLSGNSGQPPDVSGYF